MMVQRLLRIGTLSIFGWYLFLITTHYFNQRALWNDEACIFISIRDFTPQQFFTIALSSVQQFPRVYILCIQTIARHFDYSLLALRFMPFVFMGMAAVLWMRIAVKELPREAERLAFILCFAASIPLIYYAAELKQYSMDVCSVAACILFMGHQKYLSEHKKNVYLFCLIALPTLGLFSYIVFLMFVFVLWNIIRCNGIKSKYPIGFVSSVLAVGLFVYYFDLRIGNGAALRDYWREYFISFHSIPDFLGTFSEGVNNLISRWFAETPKWIRMCARFFLAFGLWEMCAGFKEQFKKEGHSFFSVGSLALPVFAGLFVLGALRVYAFTVPRIDLFFAPIILLLTVKGMSRLKAIHSNVYKVVFALFIVFLMFVSLGIAREIIFKGDLGAQSVIWRVH